MESAKLSLIKKHEIQIKELLNVNPKVYYGKNAKEKMLQYVKKISRNYNGYYNPPINEIYIIKLNKHTIGTLAHELRHAYQYNHKKEEFIFYEDWYGKSDPYYSCRRTELDANRFSLKYCKENKLGWRITSRYSRKVFKIKTLRLLHKLKPGHSCP